MPAMPGGGAHPKLRHAVSDINTNALTHGAEGAPVRLAAIVGGWGWTSAF